MSHPCRNLYANDHDFRLPQIHDPTKMLHHFHRVACKLQSTHDNIQYKYQTPRVFGLRQPLLPRLCSQHLHKQALTLPCIRNYSRVSRPFFRHLSGAHHARPPFVGSVVAVVHQLLLHVGHLSITVCLGRWVIWVFLRAQRARPHISRSLYNTTPITAVYAHGSVRVFLAGASPRNHAIGIVAGVHCDVSGARGQTCCFQGFRCDSDDRKVESQCRCLGLRISCWW